MAHRIESELDGNFAKKINRATNNSRHQDWLQRLDVATSRSKEDFVKHFQSKYSSPLPIWISIELWDFGLLSTFLSGMKFKDRQEIAEKYDVPREQLFTSWMRSINHVRNICAHHCRLWNRSPSDQPKPPKVGEIPLLDHLAGNTSAHTRLYAVAAAMQFLLRTINPSTSWGARLKQHFASFPTNVSGIAISHTGFPDKWESLSLWN